MPSGIFGGKMCILGRGLETVRVRLCFMRYFLAFIASMSSPTRGFGNRLLGVTA